MIRVFAGLLHDGIHLPGQRRDGGNLSRDAGSEPRQTTDRVQRIGGHDPGLAARLVGPDRRQITLLGVGGQRAHTQAHGGDAIHHGVVDLGIQGKALAADPLDQMRFPERPLTVQQVGVFR